MILFATGDIAVLSKKFIRLVALLLIFAAIIVVLGYATQSTSADGEAAACATLTNEVTVEANQPLSELATQFTGLTEQSESATRSIIPINASSFDLPIAQSEIAGLYAGDSVLLQRGDNLQLNFNIPENGEYIFAFDAAATANSSTPEVGVSIDGEFPASDFQQFLFPIYYRNRSDQFPKDRYGNDALIPQERDVRWSTVWARDVEFSEAYPLRVNLAAGEHQLNLALNEGEIYLGNLYIVPFTPLPDYEQYLTSQPAQATSGTLMTVEAEQPTYKNETSVRPATDRSVTVTPYDTYCQLMNTLGGESWKLSGSTVYYEIDVPEDGLYAITLRAMQNSRGNFTVFRRITLNGEVPFEELNAVPFPYSADWIDVPLGGDTPYQIYLHQGVNVLGIEATNSPYLRAIETIQEALVDINALALEIRRLTGNQRDVFREWVISEYIPDIDERLNTIAQNLIDDKDALLAIDPSGASPEIMTYQMAIDNLLFLTENIDQIPIYLTRLSEGTGSAAQQLASLLPLLQSQPLALDKIYIHSPDVVVQTPTPPFYVSIFEDFRRFLHSFQPDPYQTIGAGQGELEIWVNRPRQYVNLMQLMADSVFTPQTGIRVKFSIMPDEAKLVLANAANTQPDLALGVSTNVPYELAVRNALYDLRSFPDFDSYIDIFSPGSLLGYIINDSVYAIPETQDFWVTYYREDVLDSLNIPVPQTWDEVIGILPELQRYGMNYNTVLSSGTGQKNYLMTAPYLFNYGAQLYSDGGFATGLQSDEAIAAIEFMADSFTIYGMPLTTASFYQSFRDGNVPIGISNLETYVKLTTAAPELTGLWNIDLYPATVLADGTENRWATGSAQTGIIFQNTDMPDEAWEFLKWWMSTETQADFQEQLILNYGREYLWFSANLEAFSQLDIPEEHRETILEQWQWIQEPVRLPGGYMQERELSNIWNRIVFNGANARVAIDRAIIIINREITRKMEEFGYLVDGERVRDYSIPTIDTIIGWMQNAD